MAKKKHPRLPNKFGSIKKLSGNRNNPYAVYPPTTEYTQNGAPKSQKALCYVPDWYTGFYVLMEYKNGTFDPANIPSPEIKTTDTKNDIISKVIASYNMRMRGIHEQKTFTDVYNEFYDYKYNRDQTREYAQSTISATKSAYKNSA